MWLVATLNGGSQLLRGWGPPAISHTVYKPRGFKIHTSFAEATQVNAL